MRWLAMALVVGCEVPDAAQVSVFTRAADGTYTVAPRDRGAMDDLRTVRGPIATTYHRFGFPLDGSVSLNGKVHVEYVVEDGVATATDAQGLVLWSFHRHLEDLHDELLDRGLADVVDAQFPTSLAYYRPSLEFQYNAAFITGYNALVLVPDNNEPGVPLAANAGIVRHEFGHGLFHLLTVGDPLAFDPDPFNHDRAALHEGFADAFASLSLDDPAFFDPSLVFPGRRVNGGAIATQAVMNDWDHYLLGTVVASLAWDIRLASDADTALEVLIASAEAWAAAGNLSSVRAFVDQMVTLAQDTPAASAACQARDARFPTFGAVSACP